MARDPTKHFLLLALFTWCSCTPEPANTGPAPAMASGLSTDSARSASSAAAPWVTTWGASPQPSDEEDAAAAFPIAGQTLREIVHVSVGGARVRVRISNDYGKAPLEIGSAHAALRDHGSTVISTSIRSLTFAGATRASIPAGGSVVSDPVAMSVPKESDVAVSLYFPASFKATTEHSTALQTNYLSAPGDFGAAPSFREAKAIPTWHYLSAVDVEAASDAQTIVALGDSVTDGMGSSADLDHRWPDYLAARLASNDATSARAVVNAGISGNRLLGTLIGEDMVTRFDRDVLRQAGVKYVIVLAGINDIGSHEPTEDVTPEKLIVGYRKLIARAHEHGIRIFGCTLLPFEGVKFAGFYSVPNEAIRQSVNAWIRTSAAYDAVIDFDQVVRDPDHPTHLLSNYDSGDHIHPNDAGYRAMANAIDSSLFFAAQSPRVTNGGAPK